MPKRTWAENWGASEPDYTIGKKSMASLLKKVRASTTRRVSSLSRKKSFSYAAQQYTQSIKKTYMGGKLPKIENMSYTQMERELRYHHQFWSSKTSSESGSRSEQIEQSKRIFGVDKKGRPRRLMSFDESKAFWSAYEEFYNMYKDSSARFDSSRIQQAIGTAMSSNDGYISPDVDLVETLERAMQTLEYQSSMEEQGYDFQTYDPSHPQKEFDPNMLTEKSWKRMVKEVYRGNGDALK